MRALFVILILSVTLAGLSACALFARPTPDPLIPTVPPRAVVRPGANPSATAVAATRVALLASATPAPTATEPSATATPAPTATEPPATATPAATTTSLPASPTATRAAPVSPATATTAPAPPTVRATATAPAVQIGGSAAWGLPGSSRGRVGVGMPHLGIGSFGWGMRRRAGTSIGPPSPVPIRGPMSRLRA